MGITELRRALSCAVESAMCNADDETTTPLVNLSLDEANRIYEALVWLEEIVIALQKGRAE